MRTALRSDLTTALKARDRVAVDALRSALAAIENAETPDLDAGSVRTGVTEVARRELSDGDVRAIVAGEIEERRRAADGYRQIGRDDVAERLHVEADVLQRHLSSDG